MAIGKSTVHWGVPITTPFFKRGCEKMPRLFLPGFFWDISLLRSHVSNKKKLLQLKRRVSAVFARTTVSMVNAGVARSARLGVGWGWSRWLVMSCFFWPFASRNDAGNKMMRLGAKIFSAGGSLKNCFQGTTWKAKAEADDYSHPSWSPGFDFPSWGGLTTTGGTLWEVGSWIIPTKWGPRLR